MKTENLRKATELLDDFNDFVENRSSGFLVGLPEIMAKILDWHFLIWKFELETRQTTDRVDNRFLYRELARNLVSILEKAEKRALIEPFGYEFFETFVSHVRNHERDSVDVGEETRIYYIEAVIPTFFVALVDNLSASLKANSPWEEFFPKDWMVTEANFLKPGINISRVILGEFLNWASKRIWQPNSEEYDLVLDDVTRHLFPSVDPILWAKILTFLLTPWTPGQRMKDLIRLRPRFGFIGRVYSYWMAEEGKAKEEELKMIDIFHKETINLALLIFPAAFNRSTLLESIEELETLEIVDSREEPRRKIYLQVFKEMLYSIGQKNA